MRETGERYERDVNRKERHGRDINRRRDMRHERDMRRVKGDVRLQGVFVLLLPCNGQLLGSVLCADAHVNIVVSIRQTVRKHSVLNHLVAW